MPHTPEAPPLLPRSEWNLPWIDCEMSGLCPDKERILEIALVITSADLAVRVTGPVLVIHQPDALLARMDAWNTSMHGKSGLVDKVRASRLTEQQAEDELLAFLTRYLPPQKTPLCGNSICQDRRFLRRYMPRLDAFFHYRNIDVSTLKELARRWQPHSVYKKAQQHTALADIEESIDELAHYRAQMFRHPSP